MTERDALPDDTKGIINTIVSVIDAHLATLNPDDRQDRRSAIYAAIVRSQDIAEIIHTQRGTMHLTEFAKSIKCSASYVSDVCNGKRTPGPKLLEAMGVVKEVTYKKTRRWR